MARRYCRILALLGLLLLMESAPARAATNSALGGIGGIDNGTLLDGDGTGSARVTFNVTDLALVKQARDLQGTVLPSGSDVRAGQEMYFVLYVDNPTAIPVDALQMNDLLNEQQFTYVPNTLASTTVPSGSTDAATWSGTWTPLTDDVGGPDDVASIVDSGGPGTRDRLTVGAEPAQPNQPATVPAMSRWAIRFKVRVN